VLLAALEDMLARSHGYGADVLLLPAVSTEPPAPLPLAERFLIDECAAHDRRPELSRLSEDNDGYLHVSDLVDICIRQFALARKHRIKLERRPSSVERVLWKIGNALEEHVAECLIARFGHDRILRDLHLRNDEYKIMGRPDIVVISNDAQIAVECKSINIRDFERLERPHGNHVLQALLYRWLLDRDMVGRCSLPVHKEVIIFYTAKDYARMTPYKEFHVDSLAESSIAQMKMALDLALELKQSEEAGELPPRLLCSKDSCSRAKGCPVSKLCFEA